jgi:hypothetical protein
LRWLPQADRECPGKNALETRCVRQSDGIFFIEFSLLRLSNQAAFLRGVLGWAARQQKESATLGVYFDPSDCPPA